MQTIENNGATGHEVNGATRPRGRKAARSKAAPGSRRTIKLSLDAGTVEMLSLHALKADQSISAYVREMVAKHCTAWVVHAKPGAKGDV